MWQVLKPMQTSALQEVLQMQHRTVQLVAMAGEYLAMNSGKNPTCLGYSPQKKLFFSEIIEGKEGRYRVGMNVLDLTLEILTEDLELVKMYDLNEKTTSEGYSFLKKHLFELGVDVSSMEMRMPYKLPSGPVEKESGFRVTKVETLEETLKYRANALLLLEHFRDVFEGQSTEIKTCPQHFNTSIRINLQDKETPAHSFLEIGFSINDELVDVPYFYVSLKSDTPVRFPEKMPLVRYGQWDIEKRKGAFFRINNVYDLNADKQPEVVVEFYKTAISILMDICNCFGGR